MTPRSNVILIGMPGSGKSTVGVLLAKKLCKSFVDTDLLLSRRIGGGLQALLDTAPVDAFLALEQQVILEQRFTDTVVATGGSVCCEDAAMAALKRDGLVVWLDAGFSELERRLTNLATRGVALRPGQTLRQLYDERRPLYRKWADIVVPVPDSHGENRTEAVMLAAAAAIEEWRMQP